MTNAAHVLRQVFLVLALLVAALPAEAQGRRVALVIGNAKYQTRPLANPVRDATAVAKALEALGFAKVTLRLDQNRAAMIEALRTFQADADGADVAVLYFAGHGTEFPGRDNYLVPTDAVLANELDLTDEAVPLSTVLGRIKGARELRLVILDSCRSMPFPLAGKVRGDSRGLGRVEPEDNTLIAYATKDGTTADDGDNEHSPFTAALLKHIGTPGLDVRFMFGGIRDDVMTATGRRQQPYLYGTLGRRQVMLAPGPEEAITKPVAPVEKPVAMVVKPAPVAPIAADPVLSVLPGSGKVFRDCVGCPEMVLVPAGKFLMGSRKDEAGHYSVEAPQHPIYFNRPFAVGRSSVTVEQFTAFVAATGHKVRETCFNDQDKVDLAGRTWRAPGFPQSGAHPVVCIDWPDAVAFAEWLSRKTGRRYRLPTEAEWEYAARAGTTSAYWWGSAISPDKANYNGRLEAGQPSQARGVVAGTTSVGAFRANPWGLVDIHGNAWNWVQDCWHENYADAPTGGAAWDFACKQANEHVIRGGSWINFGTDLRSATRWSDPGGQNNSIGFRLVRDLD